MGDAISEAVICAIGSAQGNSDCPPPAVVDPEANYEGAATIVVMEITDDPATPFKDAGRFVEELGSATLVTINGEGHGASYARSARASQTATD